jgi:eukaryotic-like serine/threonine-protein kinase
MLLAHAYEPVVSLRELRGDVPADLDAVILRCLEKDPAKRFQTAAELDQALAACACAGVWTDEVAAAWWRQHRTSDGAASPPSTPALLAATVQV